MKTFFHIGYPKSGSSALQKQFFNLHPQINYLGIYPTANTGIDSEIMDAENAYLTMPELKKWHENLVMYESFDEKEAKKKLTRIIQNTYKDEDIHILSNERVSSVFFSYPDITEKLIRLKKTEIDGVILVLRNQQEIILSQYREHPFDPEDLVHGKPVSIDEWIQKASTLENNFLDSLRYDKVIDECITHFGIDRVVILSFRNLFQAPEVVARKLAKKLGLDLEISQDLLDQMSMENRGVSLRYNTVRNLKKNLLGEIPISKIIPDFILESIKSVLKKGPKAAYSLKPESVTLLKEYYEKGNKEILDKYKIDLGSFK